MINTVNIQNLTAEKMFCPFTLQSEGGIIRESRRQVDKGGHAGSIYEVSTPDGINMGYYNVASTKNGEVVINNQQAFLQLSYTISGKKSYRVNDGSNHLVSFVKQEYNYLFLPEQRIHLCWEPGERLETFEIGISPDLMMRFLPEEHPFFPVLKKSMNENVPALMSPINLSLPTRSSAILYDMLQCPLEGRYKQLYLKGKITELMALQLEEYEQFMGRNMQAAGKALKQEEIMRMYMVRDIVVSNLQRPCSLIDLAHQVGTNEAYLKKQFKQVFGTTVFGYLQVIKMGEARKMLLMGQSVSEVAYLTGYKHVAHFTRAFKKHFGVAPHVIRSKS